MPGMRLITLFVPEGDLQILDDLVDLKYYPSRSEAIRMAIHDLTVVERYLILRQGERSRRA